VPDCVQCRYDVCRNAYMPSLKIRKQLSVEHNMGT
jgi:hypothetical protein